MSRTEGASGSSTPSTEARRRVLNTRLAEALRSAIGKQQSPPPADASIELRLAYLESQIAEVRSRVNGVFFALLGSLALEVVAQVSL